MSNLLKSIDNLTEALAKAKEMPIGTVSKGRKKVAKGKWVPVESPETPAKKKKKGTPWYTTEEQDKEHKKIMENGIKILTELYNDPKIKSAKDLIRVAHYDAMDAKDKRGVHVHNSSVKDYWRKKREKKDLTPKEEFAFLAMVGTSSSWGDTDRNMKRLWKRKQEGEFN